MPTTATVLSRLGKAYASLKRSPSCGCIAQFSAASAMAAGSAELLSWPCSGGKLSHVERAYLAVENHQRSGSIVSLEIIFRANSSNVICPHGLWTETNGSAKGQPPLSLDPTLIVDSCTNRWTQGPESNGENVRMRLPSHACQHW